MLLRAQVDCRCHMQAMAIPDPAAYENSSLLVREKTRESNGANLAAYRSGSLHRPLYGCWRMSIRSSPSCRSTTVLNRGKSPLDRKSVVEGKRGGLGG